MNPELRKWLSGFLDVASAKLAENDEPQNSRALAELVVDQVTKALADPETRSRLAAMLEPAAQAWLNGTLDQFQ